MYYVKITCKDKAISYDTDGGKYYHSFYDCQRICDLIDKEKDGRRGEILIKD